MNTDYHFNRNQLLALASMMLLSPALRLFPNSAAEYASQAAALSAWAAVPLLLLYIYFICRFMDKRNEGEGMAELILRLGGPKYGKAALIFVSSWFIVYGAFILRAGADRLITTIYPHSGPGLFVFVMGFICTLAALGAARSIARCAKLILPLVFGMILFILFFSLLSVEWENLLPVTIRDSLPLLISSLSALDIFTAVLFLICFLAPSVRISENSFKSYSLWLLLMTALISLLCACVVGSFGAELTVRLPWPFFSLVRNLVFFNSLQRIEALVVSIWVFPDFLLVSALLYSAQYCLRLVFGENHPVYRGEKMFSTISGRYVVPLCGASTVILALFIAKDPLRLQFWSEKLIPLANFCFTLLFVPGIYLYGKIKKKL